MHRRLSSTLLFAAGLSVCGSIAEAQELVNRSVASQLLQPTMGPELTLGVERAALFNHLHFGVGLLFDYQRRPFEVRTGALTSPGSVPGESATIVLVDNQLTADLVAGFGFGHRWLRGQLGLALPTHLLVSGNEIDDLGQQGDGFSTAGIGDLSLQLKLGLLSGWRQLSVALATRVTLPTGCAGAGGGFGSESCDREGAYRGDAGVTVSPLIVADYRVGPVTLALNLGWLFREESLVLSTRIDDRLLYGLSATLDTGRRITVLAEIVGQAGFSPSAGCRTYANHSTVCDDPDRDTLESYPLEAMAAGALHLRHGLSAVLGAGAGLIRAIGSPQFRVLAGVRWMPNMNDTDGDGVRDGDDACPTQPEDRDGFRDADGCPDPDNDEDLIPDRLDRCPDQPEDKDSYQDDDGCPEEDNDGDGIPDIRDHCPFKAETKNGFKDDDGCPDLPDKDGDGVEDKADLCPDKPETVNGVDDADGCPDADKGELELHKDEIVLRKPVSFAGARIRPRSHAMLEQLARALKALSPIKKVSIVGFSAGPQGEQLWLKRAEAVRSFLTANGIDAGRLTARSQHEIKGAGAKTAKKLNHGGILLLLAPAPAR